jgi:uncharacterized protein (DUF2141 family)
MFNLLKRARILPLIFFQFMDIGFSEEAKISEISVTVQCSDKDSGWVYVALHNKGKTFPKKGNDAAYLSKAKISKGQVKVTFSEIPHGTYAISAFYDENGNGKLDCNFLGIPKERAGVSNNYSGLPKWEKSKFDVSSTVPLKIAIDLRG